MKAARQFIQRSEVLEEISDESGKIICTFAAPAMRRVNDFMQMLAKKYRQTNP